MWYTGVVISDTIPAELIGVTDDSSGAGLTEIEGIPYRWQVEDLGIGAGGVITITGFVRPELSPGILFTNTASITSTTAEADSTDNRSSVKTKVIIPNRLYLPVVIRH